MLGWIEQADARAPDVQGDWQPALAVVLGDIVGHR
jgi:hypothetical protein